MKDRVTTEPVRGQSFIELAIVLPLLILLGLGVFEFSRMIYAKNSIINMSREGANMASRTTTAPQDIMNAIASTAPTSVNMASNGMMYITQVSGAADNSGKIEVVAQYRWPAGNSSPSSNVFPCSPYSSGVCTPSSPRPLASLTALHLKLCDLGGSSCPTPPSNAITTAYAVEVFYKYKPIFMKIGNINYSPQLYSITVF